jgi:hypothetical protein
MTFRLWFTICGGAPLAQGGRLGQWALQTEGNGAGVGAPGLPNPPLGAASLPMTPLGVNDWCTATLLRYPWSASGWLPVCLGVGERPEASGPSCRAQCRRQELELC